ncbi:MAG: NifU family protein [Deltaproteobacteria bacterium]|nr:NifU family protein [Deltaproteobacteria bacterium]
MPGASPFPSDEVLREFLRTRVLPILAVDRGRVELARADAAAGRVVLRYAASCAGCPGLGVTHAEIVEPLLRGEFPAVTAVDALIEGERNGPAA